MKRPTIFIVDDEEKNIRLLKAMLLPENYQIKEACGGEQALNLVDTIKPDLIMLDIMMPGINGFEVCQQLKQNKKTQIIPIIMITALREKEHRIKAMEAGADDFISKPVDRTELLIRVKSLLRIKAYHDSLMKSYQEITAQNNTLLDLEKIKEGLTHMIIHDLNNPLAALLGYIDLILLDQQVLYKKHLDILVDCQSCCQDLNTMIQSLLDIHKMEEGRLEPNKENSDLVELTNAIIEQSIPQAEQKQLTLSFNRLDKEHFIPVDCSLIKRVIANLINNAIRHTPSGGKIEVVMKALEGNGDLHISVNDTGGGLAPEYHQKVFNKFEQVKLKNTGAHVGAIGLGLAFCKLAIEAHGGKIWVESEGEGKGSSFQFILPGNLQVAKTTESSEDHTKDMEIMAEKSKHR